MSLQEKAAEATKQKEENGEKTRRPEEQEGMFQNISSHRLASYN
jgi:hypothetical protein